MKFSQRGHAVLWAALFSCLLLLGGLSIALRASTQSWGEAVDGLQMTIKSDQPEGSQSKNPKFRVELRNAGEDDLTLNLGFMLANGKTQYPSAILLALTDVSGKSRKLNIRAPGPLDGRIDPLILPLFAGSNFSFRVDLTKYEPAGSTSKDPVYKLKPGTYTIEAQFTGRAVSQQEANDDVKGIALMPYWKGAVSSNQLQFEVPK
jgi:hypothetical protein